MITSFVLSMALAAPVPPAPPPAPPGPAPRLVELKANADGKVMVTVTRAEKVKVQAAIGIAVAPGGAPQPAPQPVVREVTVQKAAAVELGDVKDLTVTTTDGKKVDVAAAVKRLKGGAVVVVSADGQPVRPQYLRLFKDDVLVLASPELAGARGVQNGGWGAVPGRPGVRPLPAPAPPVVLPANPGVIQIQIQPGGVIQVAPALPPLPANPAPAPQK
jgi:hypothetical protein